MKLPDKVYDVLKWLTVICLPALGAAYLAGLAVGFWSGMEEIKQLWKCDVTFTPNMSEERRQEGKRGWAKAVGRSLNWQERT